MSEPEVISELFDSHVGLLREKLTHEGDPKLAAGTRERVEVLETRDLLEGLVPEIEEALGESEFSSAFSIPIFPLAEDDEMANEGGLEAVQRSIQDGFRTVGDLFEARQRTLEAHLTAQLEALRADMSRLTSIVEPPHGDSVRTTIMLNSSKIANLDQRMDDLEDGYKERIKEFETQIKERVQTVESHAHKRISEVEKQFGSFKKETWIWMRTCIFGLISALAGLAWVKMTQK